MGATGWTYFVPYEADIAAALQRLREDVFSRGLYSSGGAVTKSDFEAALEVCGSDLESTLQMFAERAADPSLPKQMREKFASLARQYSNTGLAKGAPSAQSRTIAELLERQGEAGTHSILDIVGVSNEPGFAAVHPLPAATLVRVFHTDKPSRRQIERKYSEGALEQYTSERWQGIYIIAYRNGIPDEVFFVGCSGD
jgi:hypothetical protein